jgi:hypothetical protein
MRAAREKETTMTSGTKVRFIEDTEAATLADQSVAVTAGTTATVIHRINDAALYVKVGGRRVIVWADEVEHV